MAYNFKSVQVDKWEVSIDAGAQYGFFEHDDYGEGGGLWFEDNSLRDYDGVYELPKDVIEGIEALGFNADYAKDEEPTP
jgi:hypothetical protein